jgi:hypothetical protein
MPQATGELTAEDLDARRQEIATRTEPARRAMRLKFARRRVQMIIGNEPRLTADELDELAALFTTAARDQRETGVTRETVTAREGAAGADLREAAV